MSGDAIAALLLIGLVFVPQTLLFRAAVSSKEAPLRCRTWPSLDLQDPSPLVFSYEKGGDYTGGGQLKACHSGGLIFQRSRIDPTSHQHSCQRQMHLASAALPYKLVPVVPQALALLDARTATPL